MLTHVVVFVMSVYTVHIAFPLLQIQNVYTHTFKSYSTGPIRPQKGSAKHGPNMALITRRYRTKW